MGRNFDNTYVRETKGKRHVCCKCKAKRHEKYMRKTGLITRWAQTEWVCNDQYCNKAWENQHFVGKLSVLTSPP